MRTSSSSRGPMRLARLVPPVLVSAALASCGSRTGLFGPEPPAIVFDASIDVRPSPDADADATIDAPVDAPTDAPLPCVPGTFAFQLASPQLMFVLDRSGSMAFALGSDTAPPPGRPTRWTTLRDALAQTIIPFDQELAMGAKFFPEATADPFDPVGACVTAAGVGIPPALGHAQTILDVFTQTSPVGGTPTSSALTLAAQYLTSSRGVARVMVLATDGAPNCNGKLDGQTCTCAAAQPDVCSTQPQGQYDCLDDVGTVGAITTIFGSQKIPVYVIGIGGASFATVLDAMAVAGGRPRAATPKYFPADTPADMTTALTTVRDSVAKCTYITPSSPQDPNAISVVVAGKAIPRDPAHVDGWDWTDQAYGQLQLFGSACTAATAANVSGTVACTQDR